MSRIFRLKSPNGALAAHGLLCLVLFVSWLLLPAKAQEINFKSDNYWLTHYTAESGLPQNSIKSIARDEVGFFWFATEDGLVRFDGRHFHTFTNSNSKLASNHLFQSFRGPKDFKLYFLDDSNTAHRIANGEINETVPYQKKFGAMNMFNAPEKGTIMAFELSNRHIYNDPWKNALLTVAANSYFRCDTSGVAYFDHGKQVYRVRNSAQKVVDYFTVGRKLYLFNRLQGSISHIDQAGAHPVAITGDIAEDGGSTMHYPGMEILWNTFAQTPLIALEGKIYDIALSGKAHFTTRLLIEGFNTGEHNIISSFYDSNTGLLLLGSHTKGLFVFTRKQFAAFKGSEGFSIHEQSLYKNRYLFTTFGTYDIFSKAAVTLPSIQKLNGLSPLLMTNDYLWVNVNGMRYLFDQEGTKLGQWYLGKEATISYADLDGNFWAGFRRGVLRKFDIHAFKWTTIRIAGLTSPISFIYQEKRSGSREKIFWIGANDGLFRLAVPGYRVEKIKNFSGSHIRSIMVRRTGDATEIWGTIWDKGLFLIKNNRITIFPLDRYKRLASAHCITEDKDGFFWVSTNKGLYQISSSDLRAYAAHSTKSLYYHYYDYKNGFLTNEFNGGCAPCSLILPNELFSLPSINGLVYFAPSAVRSEPPNKTLLIDRIEYNGKRLAYSDTLRLDENFEFLKLSASTPYFGNTDNVQIDYQLSNSQQKGSWLPVSQAGEIVFNGLSTGQYVLSLRKLNGFGANNYTTKRLILIIAPKWYETWWFKTLLLILLLLGTNAFSKWRTDTIKRQNEDLERAVSERTSALKESQNELSRQLNIQAHLIASITHDVRAPLKYVTQASRQIPKLNEMRQHKMLNEVSNALEQSLVQMTNFLDNLLSYVRTTLYHNKVEMAQVDLSELITQKLILFEKVFQLYGNEVLNEVPADLTIRSNPELLSVVVHNLIDNASKYARNGQIRIFSSTTDLSVHLIIADSGKGIDPEIREWFNNPAAAHSESYGNASPKGFGLVIVKEVARLIGLSVYVDNHNGCEFHLVFDTPESGGE
ncbi:sensor histidine kinase [Dyadobacter endophyticus]|uniref:sensor histidine kinase n=1 Tax=Dyadobacter endophyticus TaxID=1749036 RepID=UPI003CFB6FD9